MGVFHPSIALLPLLPMVLSPTMLVLKNPPMPVRVAHKATFLLRIAKIYLPEQ